MSVPGDFGLYVVMTAPVNCSYEKLTEACVREGVRMLQLREKSLCDSKKFELAQRLAGICRGSGTRFIVNDRADIAAACGADGVHLGQEDLPLKNLRAFIPGLIAGLSSHTAAQAAGALESDPDYLAFGPVYPTPAKTGRDAVTGTQILPHIASLTNKPLVAIGGINHANIVPVLESGIRNVALIRAVDCDDPGLAIRKLQDIIGEYHDFSR